MAALVLIGQGAFGVKSDQTEVIGKVGSSTVYDQTVNGSDKSSAAQAAEGDAAATIQSFGQCASAPRVVSKTKTFEVVQLTSRSCSGGGVLDCNSSGGNGTAESTAPARSCGTTTTTTTPIEG